MPPRARRAPPRVQEREKTRPLVDVDALLRPDVIPAPPLELPKPLVFEEPLAFEAPLAMPVTLSFAAQPLGMGLHFEQRFHSGLSMAPPIRGVDTLIRRTVIIPPRPPPRLGREIIWVPGLSYEAAFTQAPPDYWMPNQAVDFDKAAGSLRGTSMMGVNAVWGYPIKRQPETYIGHSVHNRLLLDTTVSDAQAEATLRLWVRAMIRFVELREWLMDHPNNILDYPLARTDMLKHIRCWAGVRAEDKALITATTIVASGVASGRVQEAERRVTGLLAAAVDCIVWHKPQWVAEVGGGELLDWWLQLRDRYEYESPRDNFLIHDGFKPWRQENTPDGTFRYAMRGEYGISDVNYVSAAGVMQDKIPLATVGWRQCLLLPIHRPLHICGVDCDDTACGLSELPLDGSCGCKNPECPDCQDWS